MTAQFFVDWVQRTYQTPNTTSAVRLAATFLHVANNTVWQWIWGLRSPDDSKLLLMQYVVTYGPLNDDSD